MRRLKAEIEMMLRASFGHYSTAYSLISSHYLYDMCFAMYQVLDRCLELEAEVSQIPQLKRQVDRYRRSHTDMEVANREKVRLWSNKAICPHRCFPRLFV